MNTRASAQALISYVRRTWSWCHHRGWSWERSLRCSGSATRTNTGWCSGPTSKCCSPLRRRRASACWCLGGTGPDWNDRETFEIEGVILSNHIASCSDWTFATKATAWMKKPSVLLHSLKLTVRHQMSPSGCGCSTASPRPRSLWCHHSRLRDTSQTKKICQSKTTGTGRG